MTGAAHALVLLAEYVVHAFSKELSMKECVMYFIVYVCLINTTSLGHKTHPNPIDNSEIKDLHISDMALAVVRAVFLVATSLNTTFLSSFYSFDGWHEGRHHR